MEFLLEKCKIYATIHGVDLRVAACVGILNFGDKHGRLFSTHTSMDFVNHADTLTHNGMNIELLYGTEAFE